MSERFRFTERRIKDLPTPDSRVEYYDTTDRLLGLRVSPGGAKTFFVKKRVHGVLIRVTLGSWPVLSLLQARKDYHEVLEQLRKGINPNLDKKRRTIENSDKRGILSAVFESYLTKPDIKDITRRGYRYSFNLLEAWWNKRIEDITPGMVEERFEEIAKSSGKYAANRSIGLLKYLMAHSMKELGRPAVNPVAGIKWKKEDARREALAPETMPAFLTALDNLKGESGADLYKLLLFTGLRKSNAMELKWSDVDLEKKSLHIGQTKNGDPLNIPISGHLAALLEGRRELMQGSAWVFPSRGHTGHITNTSNFDIQIMEQGIKVNPHMLRKTFTTTAVLLCPGPFVDILTAHIPGGVTGKHYTIPSVGQLRPYTEKITAKLLRYAAGDISEED